MLSLYYVVYVSNRVQVYHLAQWSTNLSNGGALGRAKAHFRRMFNVCIAAYCFSIIHSINHFNRLCCRLFFTKLDMSHINRSNRLKILLLDAFVLVSNSLANI